MTMNRTGKWLIAATLTLLPMAGWAQGKLIWVHNEDETWRKENPQTVLYDQEKTRLLMPQGAAFGVECIPSFSTEWTLTYDSVARALVYREVGKSLWHATYRALHKLRNIDKTHSKWELRKHPKDYVAPAVKTASLPVSNDQAWMLRAVWTSAFHDAEDREVLILDGTKWEFFIDGRRAKSHREENALVSFVNDLKGAVATGNVSRKDSLIGNAFQQVVASLIAVDKPPRKNNDSIVVIANGQQLPDSLCRLINHRPKQFYYQRGELVSHISNWTIYGAKQTFDIDCPVLELKTKPDTLSDAYVSQHPALQQTLNHYTGTVVDQDDKPIAGAWVGIYGAGAGAPTDSAGRFSFWVPRKATRFYAECPGYERLRNIDDIDFPSVIRLKKTKK